MNKVMKRCTFLKLILTFRYILFHAQLKGLILHCNFVTYKHFILFFLFYFIFLMVLLFGHYFYPFGSINKYTFGQSALELVQ